MDSDGTTMSIPAPEHACPLPFNVITGFLGAGKTTLLNDLLKDPRLAGTLVVVNEFGEVSLDHLLYEETPGEVLELASGCMCCALRGDLVETLIRVFQRHEKGELPQLTRIVVETTGLADPAPILHTIMAHSWLLQRLRLDGVVAVIDAVTAEKTFANHEEAARQAALADRHVVTKLDLLPATERPLRLQQLQALLADLHPAPHLLVRGQDDLSPTTLFGTGLLDRKGTPQARAWLGLDKAKGASSRKPAHEHVHEHVQACDLAQAPGHANVHGHTSGIRSFVLRHAGILTAQGLEIFVDLLRANFGADILRLKGLVRIAEDPSRPVVIHGVQHVFHPPARLPAWPAGVEDTCLVFITKGELEEEIRRLFAAVADPLRGHGAADADDTLSLLSPGDAEDHS